MVLPSCRLVESRWRFVLCFFETSNKTRKGPETVECSMLLSRSGHPSENLVSKTLRCQQSFGCGADLHASVSVMSKSRKYLRRLCRNARWDGTNLQQFVERFIQT